LAAPALLGAALGLGVIGLGNPARALVPYVYLPPAKEMKAAGLGIAQAAARLLRMGQAEDAARLAALTVRLIPNDPRGWILLAEAELRSNHPDQALKALARAKLLEPGNAGIWLAEGSLALRNNDPTRAVPLLRKGLELDPRNSGAYFDLGNAQIMLNETGSALTSFERASKLRPDFWEAINNQGLVLFELGRQDEALNVGAKCSRSNLMPQKPPWPWPSVWNSRAVQRTAAKRSVWPVRPSPTIPTTCSTDSARNSSGANGCGPPPAPCWRSRN
jgi:tetratricopeptide (TPR) repeat protein